MTAGESIARLAELEPNTEVRLMHQQNWPFEYGISGAWFCDATEDDAEAEGEGDDEAEANNEAHGFQPGGPRWGGQAPSQVFYLVEGEQIGYGTKVAWEQAY